MSNECRRVITLYALTEIRRILQIEENISISCQALTYTGRGMVAVHFLPESQYTQVKLTLVLDEKQLDLKQDRPRSHKSAV